MAYYYPEPLSERAEALITGQTQPVTSSLTEVEFFSAVSRKVREKSIVRSDADKIISKFISHLDSHCYRSVPVEDYHYKLARDWIGMFRLPLKTLDAIHLAICSSEGLGMITADPALFKSAKALALDSFLLE